MREEGGKREEEVGSGKRGTALWHRGRPQPREYDRPWDEATGGVRPYGVKMNPTRQPFRNPRIESFRDLVAWRKAFQLGLNVYRVAAILPAEERFGLASQLRRGAISVASNIAEGYGRAGRSDYLRFLKIARGTLYELHTQLMFALHLSYIDTQSFERAKSEVDECERILAGLIRSLERPSKRSLD